MKQLLVSAIFIFVIACNNDTPADNTPTSNSSIAAPAAINYRVVASYPHNTSSYTQGLILVNDTLYEGTGLEGFSKLMKVDLKTG